MEIKQRLNVPATYFFDRVIDSVKYDIHEATGKSLTENQLVGFEYVKEFSAKSRARILIEDVIHNEKYRFVTSTTKNSFTATYKIAPLDDKSCEVIYTEKMTSNGTIQSLNDMVVGMVFSFFKKKRFKKMLGMIEQSY